jgi:hypothetical protein
MSIHGPWCHIMRSNRLGYPCSYGHASYSPHDLCLELALLTAWSFPLHTFCIPDISQFLEFRLYFLLQPHSFMHCPLRGYLKRPWPSLILPSLPSLHWNLDGSLHYPITLAFYIPVKPESSFVDDDKSSISLSNVQDPLGQNCVFGWFEHGLMNPGHPCVSRASL